jgi:hypothetical protein
MGASENLIRQVISGARITSLTRRRELAMELSSHVEDMVDELRAAGHDEVSIQQIVSQRFGHPEEIGQAFAETYRTERIVAYIGIAAALVSASLLAVGAMISAIQFCVAIWSGSPLSADFRGMRWEFVGFLCLTWGYVGIYLGERLFRNRLLPAATGNVLLFLPAALGFHYLVPGHLTAPIVAFVCAGMVRVLQRSNVRFIWCAGTAGPLLCAWLLLGPIVRSDGPLTSWEMGLTVWLGMTLSCLAMTSVTKFFDRRIFTTLHLGS